MSPRETLASLKRQLAELEKREQDRRKKISEGMRRAKKTGKPIGRPKRAGVTVADVKRLRAQGMGINAIAKQLQIGVSTVHDIVSPERKKRAQS